MNRLEQNSSLLLGKEEDIKKVAELDEAKILVFSDSHDNFDSFLKPLKKFGPICNAAVFLGDGARDIESLYELAAVEPELQYVIPPVLAVVEGNNDHDTISVRNLASENPYFVQIKLPLSNTMTVAGHTIFMTHGHRYGLYCGLTPLAEAAKRKDAEAAFFGHTHVPMSCLISGNIFMLNPGSTSRPRSQDPASYAVVSLKKGNPHYDTVFFDAESIDAKPFVPSVTSIF